MIDAREIERSDKSENICQNIARISSEPFDIFRGGSKIKA